ncbi:MAG: hypothetical protein AAF513_10590 [Pseudomonadota bacterium]
MEQREQMSSIHTVNDVVRGEASEPVAQALAVYSPLLFWVFISSVVGGAFVVF